VPPPTGVRPAFRRQRGRIVYKVFHGSTWKHEEKTWTPFTSLVTEAEPPARRRPSEQSCATLAYSAATASPWPLSRAIQTAR
jgi:hypothetical protein